MHLHLRDYSIILVPLFRAHVKKKDLKAQMLHVEQKIILSKKFNLREQNSILHARNEFEYL